MYGFLFAFHSNYGRIFNCLWDIQRQSIAWPWKMEFGVVQGHWNWRRSIDHIWLAIVNIALSCTVFELFDTEYRDLEILVRGHSRSFKLVPLESLLQVAFYATWPGNGSSLYYSSHGQILEVARKHVQGYRTVRASLGYRLSVHQCRSYNRLNTIYFMTYFCLLSAVKQEVKVIWQKAPHGGAHSPVRGHHRGSKVVPLNSWGRVSY